MRTIHMYLFAFFSLLCIYQRTVCLQKVQGSSAFGIKETSGPIRYRIKIKRYVLLAMLWICIGLNADQYPRSRSRDLIIKICKILQVEKNSYFFIS
jgi:hypothetical protein